MDYSEIELDEKTQKFIDEQGITKEQFLRGCDILVEELLKCLSESDEIDDITP